MSIKKEFSTDDVKPEVIDRIKIFERELSKDLNEEVILIVYKEKGNQRKWKSK